MQRRDILKFATGAAFAGPERVLGGPAGRFVAVVEQDGRRQALVDEVRLRRAPFQIVFRGDPGLDYVAVSDLDAGRLGGRTDAAGLAELFQDGSAGAEAAVGDVSLFVNDAGERPLTWQYWFDDPGGGGTRRFASYEVQGDEAVATRRIAEVYVISGFNVGPRTPIEAFGAPRITLLAAGKPRGGPEHTFVDPWRATIVFEGVPGQAHVAG